MKVLDMEREENSDCDVCDGDEIKSIFDKSCKCLSKCSISGENEYILHIDATLESSPTIAIGSSGSTIDIFTLSDERMAKLDSLNDPIGGPCIGVSFAKNDHNLLYTGYQNGSVKLWDLREAKQSISSFEDTTVKEGDQKKPMTCFDVAPNNRLLAAGTELVQGDAFVLFWDVRNVKLLGAYWESHTDDVTQLKFDSEDADQLISGSTDGLINIYDLKEASEDDALVDSLNTESSIEGLAWCRVGKTKGIFCSTHTHDVQLWRLDGAEPYTEFKRDVLGTNIKRKSDSHSYVVGAHTTKEDEVFILVGSNYNNGECLRGLFVEDKALKPAFDFSVSEQRIRASLFNLNTNVLITGGESGAVNAWKLDTSKKGKR